MKNHTSAAARLLAFLLVGLMPLLAAAGVPPVHLTNIVLQKYGEESKSIIFKDGQLFWDSENDTLFIGDGVTPGGKACCPHFGKHYEIDYHTFTNTLHVHGNDIEFNAFWSQVGEGGSMLYRFGTNSFLRFVGARQGTLANLAVDAYDPNAGTMTLTADATNAPILQVATNLLEVDPWRDATNATLLGATDASTSWHIDLLGTSFETYRCLASVDREEGIYAERTFYADDGVSMAGEKWDHWPDIDGKIAAATIGLATGEVAAVSARVSYIEADYVVSSDIADFATTGSVASVERRVSTLEMPDTCFLFWTESYVHANVSGAGNFIDVPTNFPTKNLYLVVDDNDISPLGIKIDTWDPGRDVTIEIVPVRTTEGTTNRATYVRYNGLQAGAVTATNQYRIIRLQYDNIVRTWNAEQTAVQTRRYFFDAEGNRTQLPPESVPATVEQWLSIHQEWATP